MCALKPCSHKNKRCRQNGHKDHNRHGRSERCSSDQPATIAELATHLILRSISRLLHRLSAMTDASRVQGGTRRLDKVMSNSAETNTTMKIPKAELSSVYVYPCFLVTVCPNLSKLEREDWGMQRAAKETRLTPGDQMTPGVLNKSRLYLRISSSSAVAPHSEACRWKA